MFTDDSLNITLTALLQLKKKEKEERKRKKKEKTEKKKRKKGKCAVVCLIAFVLLLVKCHSIVIVNPLNCYVLKKTLTATVPMMNW